MTERPKGLMNVEAMASAREDWLKDKAAERAVARLRHVTFEKCHQKGAELADDLMDNYSLYSAVEILVAALTVIRKNGAKTWKDGTADLDKFVSMVRGLILMHDSPSKRRTPAIHKKPTA